MPHLNNLYGTMQGQYIAAATHIVNNEFLANAVIDKDTGVSLEYKALSTGPNKETWITSLVNDFGRLTQGVGNRIRDNNTMFFIPPSNIPNG